MLYNFYIFYIDTLYNMIYNKIIKGTDKQPLERMGKRYADINRNKERNHTYAVE